MRDELEQLTQNKKGCISDAVLLPIISYGSSMKQAQTLGRLRKSGWLSRTVKEEIRQNAIKRIQQGEELFPGVLGYENTVIPQLEKCVTGRT